MKMFHSNRSTDPDPSRIQPRAIARGSLVRLLIVFSGLAAGPFAFCHPAADAAQESTAPKLSNSAKRFLANKRVQAEAMKSSRKAASEEPAVENPRPALKPVVFLSEEHRAECLVQIGDELPGLSLPDSEGKAHALRADENQAVAVVLFWNVNDLYSLDEFTEIENHLGPFRNRAVQLITVHVGPVPGDYREICSTFAAGGTHLIDRDRAAFGQVARRRLPRTYVIDAAGKIVWFDFEYSRSTREALVNAIRYTIGQPKGAAKPAAKAAVKE